MEGGTVRVLGVSASLPWRNILSHMPDASSSSGTLRALLCSSFVSYIFDLNPSSLILTSDTLVINSSTVAWAMASGEQPAVPHIQQGTDEVIQEDRIDQLESSFGDDQDGGVALGREDHRERGASYRDRQPSTRVRTYQGRRYRQWRLEQAEADIKGR